MAKSKQLSLATLGEEKKSQNTRARVIYILRVRVIKEKKREGEEEEEEEEGKRITSRCEYLLSLSVFVPGERVHVFSLCDAFLLNFLYITRITVYINKRRRKSACARARVE